MRLVVLLSQWLLLVEYVQNFAYLSKLGTGWLSAYYNDLYIQKKLNYVNLTIFNFYDFTQMLEVKRKCFVILTGPIFSAQRIEVYMLFQFNEIYAPVD